MLCCRRCQALLHVLGVLKIPVIAFPTAIEETGPPQRSDQFSDWLNLRSGELREEQLQ